MSDIKKVKVPRTLIQVILHYLYHLCKRYLRYQKQLLEDITLFDDGMKIIDSFIPYEYLVSVSDEDMILLAKVEDEKLVPCDNLIRLNFKKRIDSNIILNNLYYHLKYNKISLDVMGFKSIKPVVNGTVIGT